MRLPVLAAILLLHSCHPAYAGDISDLIDVHAQMRAGRYVSDMERFGVSDKWVIADGAGDCEDWALWAMHELMARGWPREKLFIIKLRTQPVNHAVLCVRGKLRTADAVCLDKRESGLVPMTAYGVSGEVIVN